MKFYQRCISCPNLSKTELDILLSFTEIFEAFKDVRTACFGQDVEEDFDVKIDMFVGMWKNAGISMTSKMHILDRHVKEILWKEESIAAKMQKKPRGLGATSEQAIGNAYFFLYRFISNFDMKLSTLLEPFSKLMIFNFPLQNRLILISTILGRSTKGSQRLKILALNF